MKTFELTEKEMRAAVMFVASCLDAMGGKRPSDLETDELTWVDINDLIAMGGYNRHEAAGLMGSLCEKGFLLDYDNDPAKDAANWVVTTEGWKWLDTVWDDYLGLVDDDAEKNQGLVKNSTGEAIDTVIMLGEFLFASEFVMTTKTGMLKGTWTSTAAIVDPTYRDAMKAAERFLNETGDHHHVYLEAVHTGEGNVLLLRLGS